MLQGRVAQARALRSNTELTSAEALKILGVEELPSPIRTEARKLLLFIAVQKPVFQCPSPLLECWHATKTKLYMQGQAYNELCAHTESLCPAALLKVES